MSGHNPRRHHRLIWTSALVAFSVLTVSASAAVEQRFTTDARKASGFGAWNGVVSFQTTSNYTKPNGKVTSSDSRVYTVHGGADGTYTASMTGQGRMLVTSANHCGPTTEGWGWKGSGKVPSTSIIIDGSEIYFSFSSIDALYANVASGADDIQYATGTKICGQKISPTPGGRLGTGSGYFQWHIPGKPSKLSQYLLRSSGSSTVKHGLGGNPNPAAGTGSIGGNNGQTLVTWNVTRIGPDKDHDGLSDQGDPNPNNPDTDGDGFPDGWEVDHGTNPNNNTSHPVGPWWNGARDSDGDGFSDATEISKGTDPNNPTSHPNGNGDTGPIVGKPGGDEPGRPKPPGCLRSLVVVISAPGSGPGGPFRQSVAQERCVSSVIGIGPSPSPFHGCNSPKSGGFWAWNEIQSPRGGTDQSEVKRCAAAHPGAPGFLYYAGDTGTNGYWSTAWQAPAGVSIRGRFLELYGCNQVKCHFDVTSGNMVERWKRLSGRFSAMVNVGGIGEDAAVKETVLRVCRATKTPSIGFYWGTGEYARITASRTKAVREALNTCLGG